MVLFFYVKEHSKLFKHLKRKNFIVEMDTFVTDRINKLVNNIIESDNHKWLLLMP